MPDLAPPRPEAAEAAPAIWRVVEEAREIAAVAHKDPDGDTLGSALALAAALKPQGRSVVVVASPPVSAAWSFLPGFAEVNRAPVPAGVPLFVFDAGDPGRTGIHEEAVRRAPVVVNIDHHVTNTLFGTLNLVVSSAASTGELVYDLLKAWAIPIPPDAASCLYVTILSDTGGFRHDNTSEHALRSAAELVALGANPALIARALFKSRPASTLRMQGRILQGLHFEYGDRLVWASVTLEALRESGATTDQADGAIDQLNTVRGQEMAILFKEVGPQQTKVSIRTRDQVDAAALAARFGGGGHHRAAGIDLARPLESAQLEVLAEARRAIQALDNE